MARCSPGCASAIYGRGTGLNPRPVTMASVGANHGCSLAQTGQGTERGASVSWGSRLRQRRVRRQGTAPAVCAGRLPGVAGVRGRGSSVWGEV